MIDTPQAEAPTGRTRQHYQTLLAPLYRWMLGDLPAALARSNAELRELGVNTGRPGARALDLGAGLGLQTLPLSGLGYDVTAVDSSPTMLSELAQHCPEAHRVQADLADLRDYSSGPYDVVVCMGDTLTHLTTFEDVHLLLYTVSTRLAPGGLFLLTFRDYSGPPRRSTDRFLQVRSDAKCILTCCLDYHFDRVTVTDVVHERTGSQWAMRASAYEKLRLAPSTVADRLRASGLLVERCESKDGRVAIVARRPRPGEPKPAAPRGLLLLRGALR